MSIALISSMLFMLLFAAGANAQIPSIGEVFRHGDVTIVYTPDVACEPGTRLLGLFTCPEKEEQGVLVHVRADDWSYGSWDSYNVTIQYRTESGVRKSITHVAKREAAKQLTWDTGWRAVAFVTGRVAVGTLSGSVVESVTVAKALQPTTFEFTKKQEE